MEHFVYGFLFIGPFDFVRSIRSSVSFRSRDETTMEVFGFLVILGILGLG